MAKIPFCAACGERAIYKESKSKFVHLDGTSLCIAAEDSGQTIDWVDESVKLKSETAEEEVRMLQGLVNDLVVKGLVTKDDTESPLPDLYAYWNEYVKDTIDLEGDIQ